MLQVAVDDHDQQLVETDEELDVDGTQRDDMQLVNVEHVGPDTYLLAQETLQHAVRHKNGFHLEVGTEHEIADEHVGRADE